MRFRNGHKAVILGAGGTIGGACVHAFAEAGASVAALDLDGEKALLAIHGLAGEHSAHAVDATDPQALVELATALAADGPVHSLVYAAGIAFTANLGVTDWAMYRRLMAVNLDGAFYSAQAFLPCMLQDVARAEHGGSSIVLLSSMAGLRGEAGATAYCASKFALIGLAQSLAAELAPKHIRVNAVCPGNVEGPLLEQVCRDIAVNLGIPVADVMAANIHVGAARRLVSPQEVAQTCLWLSLPAASAITGESIRVDCGALVG